MRWTLVVTAAACGMGSAVVAGGAAAASSADRGSPVTNRVSVSSDGGQANQLSYDPDISADGRYVAFFSYASNLVPHDTNGRSDVFVRDRVTHVTRRVSVAAGGQDSNRPSNNPAISADGRYVAFRSYASNLVAGDTNGRADVFVRDRVAKVTQLVSVGPGGAQANGYSLTPDVSAHGRYVTFTSAASNLVAGDTNGTSDVFVRDRVAQVTKRVSVGPDGAQADSDSGFPAISADGRYIAFNSSASNLGVVDDTNGRQDVFVRDRVAEVTRRVSVSPDGAQGDSYSFDPAISAHGRYVAFRSRASNLVTGDTNRRQDVFVRDRAANVTQRVSVGPGGAQADNGSLDPAISAHGRFVAFSSNARNLVTGDTNGKQDVFVRDRAANVTQRVSVGPGGTQANSGSGIPAISAHGRYVAFRSRASNLVAGDTNGTNDVFVRNRGTG